MGSRWKPSGAGRTYVLRFQQVVMSVRQRSVANRLLLGPVARERSNSQGVGVGRTPREERTNHGNTGKFEIGRVQAGCIGTSIGDSSGNHRCPSRLSFSTDTESAHSLEAGQRNSACCRRDQQRRRGCRFTGRRDGGKRRAVFASIHRRRNNSSPRLGDRLVFKRNGRADEASARVALSPDGRPAPQNRRDQRHRARRLGSPKYEQQRRRTSRRRSLIGLIE